MSKTIKPKAPKAVAEEETKVVPAAAAETPAKASKAPVDDINIADPEELRPKELPLVITPSSKGWANEAQEEYARILNGYAYANPTKFKAKKEVLIARLRDLADNPHMINVYKGGDGAAANLEFKNHITQS